jgi:hypothetical protein
MVAATVTTNGHLLIPQDMRDRLGLTAEHALLLRTRTAHDVQLSKDELRAFVDAVVVDAHYLAVDVIGGDRCWVVADSWTPTWLPPNARP